MPLESKTIGRPLDEAPQIFAWPLCLRSGQDFMRNMAADIRETEIAAAIAVS